MPNKRNLSVLIPISILGQLNNRALIHGRSRNAEVRYLIDYALEAIGEADTEIGVPAGECKKITVRIGNEAYAVLIDRSQEFKRSVGPELLRVIIAGIQTSTDRNLAIIEDMMRHRGRATLAILATEQAAALPDLQG